MTERDRERPIRILTVDDHPALRDGIGAIIGLQPDMVVVGEAENGTQALAAFQRLQPDITLMDLQMPRMGGADTIKLIRAQFPNARIIVLTTYSGDVRAVRALRAGAAGYLLKSSLRTELLETIRAVHAGLRRVSPEIAGEIAAHAGEDALTEREIDVLVLASAGNANKQIARDLSVSEDTIKANMRSIFTKLDVKDRTQAVTVAVKRGIIDS